MDLASGESSESRPAWGKTTCAFFRPVAIRSSLARRTPIEVEQLQEEELAFRASGKERRYSWDYDPEMDIWDSPRKSGRLRRLTTRARLRSEASYSPDGQWIAFSSIRDAYQSTARRQGKEDARGTRSYFAESTS